jgi:PAS domain S-box-containing protein
MLGKILLMEDEEHLLDNLEILLTDEGYHVVTAKNGEEGIQCLVQEPFDIVITDIMMGDMSGFAIMEYIVAHRLDTLVIFITGFASTESAIAALRQGVYDYIAKPFEMDMLLIAVKRALEKIRDVTERRRAEAQLRHQLDFTEAITTHLGEGIYALDTHGRLTFMNPAAEAALGWSQHELLGQEIHAVIHGQHADHIPLPAEACPILAVLHTGQTRHVDRDLFTQRGGTLLPVSYTASPIRTGGQVVGAVIVFHDSTERQRAEEQLRHSHARLRALTARLESLREAERIRIAREMHDELSQKLTGLKMDLRWTERKLGALASSPIITTLLDRVAGATELVDSLIGSVQAIATDLRPGVLDQLGLGMALHYEARRFQERTAILSEVCLPAAELSLAPDLATALFRIFQECLSNVARHAGATQVKAALTVDHGWVTLRVQDNGRGITAAEMSDPRALGLLGMKERAALLGGEVLFARGPEHDTIVTARMPLQTQKPRMIEK